MFERLSPQAARAIIDAKAEARLLGHEFIGTEHLLLGLLTEQETVATRAMAARGVDVPALRHLIRDLGRSATSVSLMS